MNTSIINLNLADVSSSFRTLRYPYIYLATIAIAEVVTTQNLYLGGIIHFGVLVTLFVHSVFTPEKPLADFLTALTCAPLIRILSITTPLEHFNQAAWFAAISVPVFIAAYTIIHLQGLTAKQVFLTRPKLRYLHLELLLMPIAFAIGLIEYQLLEPSPLADYSLREFIPTSMILIVNTGILEELVFRGLMQYNAERLAGFHGLVFVSLLFGVLHITNLVFWDVLLAAGAGLLFAVVIRKTGSIWGVSIAHGMTNISLFIIAPQMF